MGKYPSLQEYQNKPAKGVQRCDELLKKNPKDVLLLTTKLQLQCRLADSDASTQTLADLLEVQPPIQSLNDINTIEGAIVDLQQDTLYPPPTTAGPQIAKLWENAAKATQNTDQKLNLHSLRFSRAIVDNRLTDAQQSLIHLKALLPKNRTTYMAHAALTQMLSKSNDDLQARLALSLARKAVTEKFDEDKNLDCRVAGQIFAIQKSEKDLEGIAGRSFADSKQVFRATRRHQERSSENHDATKVPEPAKVSTREWLTAEVTSIKAHFTQLCQAVPCDQNQLRAAVSNAIRLFVLAAETLTLRSSRSLAELIFLAISSLIKLWILDQSTAHLLQLAFLAETLLSYQPKVHEAKVFLVYIYSRLGLISLAAKEWEELAVKEVQLDTVGHIFMTRLSVSHPHPFKSKKMKESNPQRTLSSALSMYHRVEDKLSDTHASVLSNGQSGMLFDLYEVRECLRRSVTKRIVSLEERRLARLTGRALNDQFVHVHPQLLAAWLDLKDNRDFTTTFDFGISVDQAVYGNSEIVPWLLSALATDSAWCLIHNAIPAVKDTSSLLQKLDGLSESGYASDAEFVAGTLAHLILREVYSIGSDSNNDNNEIKSSPAPFLEAVKDLAYELLIDESEALPLRTRSICCYLDTLRLATTFSTFAESKKAFTKEQGAELRAAINKAFTALQSYSTQQASALRREDIEHLVKKDDDLTNISKILPALGRDHLTTFATNIVESAKDAWAGPAFIKA